RQRGDVRRRARPQPRSLAAPRAAGAPPSGLAPRPPAAPRRGPAPVLPPAGSRRARARTDDRLSRRLLVHGGGQGDLVQGRRADAPRDRAPAAQALSLRLLLVSGLAALHPRPEPARSSPGAKGPRARRRRVLSRRGHRLRDAPRRRAQHARRGALPPGRRRAGHGRRVPGVGLVAPALPAPETPPPPLALLR